MVDETTAMLVFIVACVVIFGLLALGMVFAVRTYNRK